MLKAGKFAFVFVVGLALLIVACSKQQQSPTPETSHDSSADLRAEIRQSVDEAHKPPPGYELASGVRFEPPPNADGVRLARAPESDAGVPISVNCGVLNPGLRSGCSYKQSTGSCAGSQKNGALDRNFGLVAGSKVTGTLAPINCGNKTQAEGNFWSTCKFATGIEKAEVEVETYVEVKRSGGCRDCEGSGATASPRWSGVVKLPGNPDDQYLVQALAAANFLKQNACTVTVGTESATGPTGPLPFIRVDHESGPGELSVVIDCREIAGAGQMGAPPNEACRDRRNTSRPVFSVSVYKRKKDGGS